MVDIKFSAKLDRVKGGREIFIPNSTGESTMNPRLIQDDDCQISQSGQLWWIHNLK